MEYHEFRAMNSEIVLAAEGEPEGVAVGFAEAQSTIEAYEQRFTRFSEQSELSRLNRSQGEWFQASPALFEIAALAGDYYHRTGGLFDPSILPALKRAGYDRSMDEIRFYGAGQESQPAPLREANYGAVRFEKGTGRIWLPPGMEIDLGGIAKGWIASQAAAVLARNSNACAVSAGGDMVFIGVPGGESRWDIALEDPRDPGQTLAGLRVGPGAVATSSITKRSWTMAGKQQHHLIDPLSAEPAITDCLSMTVIAPQTNAVEPSCAAATAEVFAKVLLIAGLERAMGIASRNGEIAFIAVDRQGKLWGSPKSMEFLDVHPNHG